MWDPIREVLPRWVVPLVGGFLIWWAVCYAFLGPAVIGPRLRELVFMPACGGMVGTGQAKAAERIAAMDEAFNERFAQALKGAERQTGGFLRDLLGAYGAEGRAYVDRHGDKLDGLTGLSGPFQGMIYQQARADYEAEKRAALAKEREAIKFPAPAAFCGCAIDRVLENRIDLATYAATLRLIAPPAFAQLARGETAPECGAPPVL